MLVAARRFQLEKKLDCARNYAVNSTTYLSLTPGEVSQLKYKQAIRHGPQETRGIAADSGYLSSRFISQRSKLYFCNNEITHLELHLRVGEK